MSAHLCLTAWKEPMGGRTGTGSWRRRRSSPGTCGAPPACSAASATQARSSTRLIRAPAWPSAPIRTAGTWSRVRTAIARVGSSVVIGSARSPGAPRSTANRPGPAVLRATTSTRSAIAPSMTKLFLPLSRQPHPPPHPLHSLGPGRDHGRVPRRVAFGRGQRGDGPPGGDAGQVPGAGRLVRRGEQRLGGEHHRGEEGRAQPARPPSPPAPPRARSGRTRHRRTRWAAPGPAA